MARRLAKQADSDEPVQNTKSIPINNAIYNTLRQRILDNVYTDTGCLPPELTLMEEFDVSRHTIRVSLQKLVADGLIDRRRGARTAIVQRDMAQATWAAASLDHMLGRFHDTEVLFVGHVRANAYPQMALKFGISESDFLFQVIMVLKSKQGPLSYSVLFTRPEYGKHVPEADVATDYFINLLERHSGLRAVRAQQITSAILPTPQICAALGIAATEPVLTLNRLFFNGTGDLIEYGIMHCRPDTFPQIVNFYRQDDIAKRF